MAPFVAVILHRGPKPDHQFADLAFSCSASSKYLAARQPTMMLLVGNACVCISNEKKLHTVSCKIRNEAISINNHRVNIMKVT